MIETHDLSKKFDSFTAVDGVTLNIQPGEVLALLGPNGAGKTTTVRMLTSILSPSRGWARVAGYDVVQQPAQVRANVGVLTEQHGLYGRMPADDYLDFFGQVYGIPQVERRKRIQMLLDEYGLHDFRHHRTGEFSKGMRQKLALARALMHNPPVLLLDEPTSAMDPESARLVRDAIHQLRSSNRAVIICTHNLPEAEELADQIAIIRRGVLIAQGTPAQLKATLLGPQEFEVRLSSPVNAWVPELPAQASLTGQGSDWFRYTTTEPHIINPAILNRLLAQDIPVFCLSEVNQSLEKVYLQAIASGETAEASHVG
jgi:ABC-2 type transport system ATP-binding protein